MPLSLLPVPCHLRACAHSCSDTAYARNRSEGLSPGSFPGNLCHLRLLSRPLFPTSILFLPLDSTWSLLVGAPAPCFISLTSPVDRLLLPGVPRLLQPCSLPVAVATSSCLCPVHSGLHRAALCCVMLCGVPCGPCSAGVPDSPALGSSQLFLIIRSSKVLGSPALPASLCPSWAIRRDCCTSGHLPCRMRHSPLAGWPRSPQTN